MATSKCYWFFPHLCFQELSFFVMHLNCPERLKKSQIFIDNRIKSWIGWQGAQFLAHKLGRLNYFKFNDMAKKLNFVITTFENTQANHYLPRIPGQLKSQPQLIMSQLHEIKLMNSVNDVLKLLTAIMTLIPYLRHPIPPKCGPCVTTFPQYVL